MTDDLTVRDIIHGAISVPSYLVPFLRMPEFVRLRGVRLSNLDSIEFKDLNGPTRWEHAIGVVHLAGICAQVRGLSLVESVELQLAALLHDIATPPFAHTAEYVLENYDHEDETSKLLSGQVSRDVAPHAAIYLSEAPRFPEECRRVSRSLKISVDPERVADLVIGEGELGFLLAGSVDLDNADNVVRASMHMGLAPRREMAVDLAKFLAGCESAPTTLHDHPAELVREWAALRQEMYASFFGQGGVERGREAFLQHLFRKAMRAGVPRRQLVWNTDEGLLSLLADFKSGAGEKPLSDAVKRYRLLEDPYSLITIPVFNSVEFAALSNPSAISWIEKELTGPYFEAIVTFARNRFASHRGNLEPLGEVRIFKLGGGISNNILPDRLREHVPSGLKGVALSNAVRRALSALVQEWSTTKPWLTSTRANKESLRANLEAVGNWEFRLSRNSPLHTYPSTFVQELPSTLIHALGMTGELVLDPFGGTGNTALAAILANGRGVTGDSNQIATLIARVRGTYLDTKSVSRIRLLQRSDLESSSPADRPDLVGLEKWHHASTIEQLQHVLAYCEGLENETERNFMKLSFSSILTACTARRGEEGSYFADNTPLRKGETGPPVVDAFDLFQTRVKKNLSAQLAFMARLEGKGIDPESRLGCYSAVLTNALSSAPEDYGVEPHSVGLILTSPPYLGMTDYALGHRLSYAWLGLDMSQDFQLELSPRRARPRATRNSRPDRVAVDTERAVLTYMSSMRQFAGKARNLLVPQGLVAMVQGESTAKAFASVSILDGVDTALAGEGLRIVWSGWRPITWSRHHGFARVRRERIAVYQLE